MENYNNRHVIVNHLKLKLGLHMKSSDAPDLSVISRRDQIFQMLDGQEDWCSGEHISKILGISRMAVAKHVANLRASGHAIKASPRRGYRLEVKTDDLSIESIQKELETKLLGCKEWRYFKDTSSTNKDAITWAEEGAETGCVVFTDHQTQGRGKKGKNWFSTPRAIQCSVILHPALKEEQMSLLTVLGTVATAEAIIKCTSLAPKLKYPNDILLNGRKICGILTEISFQAGEMKWAVLGIGCNVNGLQNEFSADLQPKASSLFIEGNAFVARPALFASILERIEFWYEYLSDGKTEELLKRWETLR